MTPADGLRILRQKGKGPREIGRLLGLDPATIWRIEKGRVEPFWSNGQRIIALAKEAQNADAA